MTAASVSLRFQIGARTLAAVPRRLERVSLSLDDVLANRAPTLPPLPPGAHGYSITSLPEHQLAGVMQDGLIAFVRQRYTRYHVDLAAGEPAWRAGLSGQTRSTLKRKAKKLAEATGRLDIRAYRTADDMAGFEPLARALAAKTYQHRLLGAELPSLAALQADAGRDDSRAWLLFSGDDAIAYLCCLADGDTLRYDHVGHDPAWSPFSPGTVLMEAALTALFVDRFARFDFTEGEGQHKRGLASGGSACVDLLLLRPTLANRALVAALAGFDRAVALAKRWSRAPGLAKVAKAVRRA